MNLPSHERWTICFTPCLLMERNPRSWCSMDMFIVKVLKIFNLIGAGYGLSRNHVSSARDWNIISQSNVQGLEDGHCVATCSTLVCSFRPGLSTSRSLLCQYARPHSIAGCPEPLLAHLGVGNLGSNPRVHESRLRSCVLVATPVT